MENLIKIFIFLKKEAAIEIFLSMDIKNLDQIVVAA